MVVPPRTRYTGQVLGVSTALAYYNHVNETTRAGLSSLAHHTLTIPRPPTPIVVAEQKNKGMPTTSEKKKQRDADDL